jgi:hypothetical protein
VIPELALVPSRRSCRRLDVAAALMAAVFTALGVVVGVQLWNLTELHRGLLDAAAALETTGRAIDVLGGVPLLGDGARGLADDVTASAGDIRADALAARDGVRTVAVAVGAAIALIGLLPVALVHVPIRLVRHRELRALRGAVARAADPMLVEHLARAAVRRVPYAELRRVSRDPWSDLAQGRHAALAEAELRRLGVEPAPAAARPPDGPGRG